METQLAQNLNKVKKINPLTHCITNKVTINDCANAILAIGATPIMAEDERELEDIIKIANSLVINIGTIDKKQEKAILKACRIANNTNTPILFDPVGVGISLVRNNLSLEIIKNYNISAIRGNMSEIKAIASLIFNKKTIHGKGVDVNDGDITTKNNLKRNSKIVKKIAKELKTVVIASGPIDIISNGENTIAIENGHEIMPLITGSGCMLSAICGSCIGVCDSFNGSVLACLLMTIAGEYAGNSNYLATGTFRTLLIDYLGKITSEDLEKQAKILIL